MTIACDVVDVLIVSLVVVTVMQQLPDCIVLLVMSVIAAVVAFSASAMLIGVGGSGVGGRWRL